MTSSVPPSDAAEATSGVVDLRTGAAASVIATPERLEATTSAALVEHILSQPGDVVIVDFSRTLELPTQATLSALVQAHTALRWEHRYLYLVAVPAELVDLIEYVEYSRLLQLFDSLDAALRAAAEIAPSSDTGPEVG